MVWLPFICENKHVQLSIIRTLLKLPSAVIAHVEASQYKTLEALATAIARIAIVDCGASHLRVQVEKPHALRFADNVMVIIERKTEDFV